MICLLYTSLCHIKFRGVAGTLAVSYENAVEPYMVRALHPVKSQDILSVLLLFFMKHMTVNTGGIIRLYPRIIPVSYTHLDVYKRQAMEFLDISRASAKLAV